MGIGTWVRSAGRRAGIDRVLGRLGYRLVPLSHATVDREGLSQYLRGENDEYLALYRRADELANPEPYRSPGDFGKQRRFFIVHQMARHVLRKGVPGDFVELGCNFGHSAYIIAQSLRALDARDFWVFDSFEGGLSEKVEHDLHDRGDLPEHETRKQQRRFSSDFDSVRRLFAEMQYVHLVKGWIPDVLTAEFAGRSYAFVHVDVDLYEPTLASLEFFFPRLSSGGAIVVDDYGSSDFPGAQRAVDEFVARHDVGLFLVNHLMGCLIVK